jgi:hypothetical protein
MFTPIVRQWIYTAAALASALIPLLVAYHIIDSTAAGAWVNVVGVLGALGSGGAGIAAVMTSKQRKDGTLDFTGSAAEQAVAALQATVDQAVHAADNLDKVKAVVTSVVGAGSQAIKVIPGSLVEQLLNVTDGK